MLPYFKRSEDQEGGDRALHGTGGPLGVSDARISLPVIDAFVAGCGQAFFQYISRYAPALPLPLPDRSEIVSSPMARAWH